MLRLSLCEPGGLRQAETGTEVTNVSAAMGVGEQTTAGRRAVD